MTEAELRSELKSPAGACGAYFFYGDEDYMKNYFISQIKSSVVLNREFEEFNVISLREDEGGASALLSALESPPVMSEKKLVTLTYYSLDARDKKEKAELLETVRGFFENGITDTVFILSVYAGGFEYGNAKKPSSFLADASKIMKCVNFEYRTETKLIGWMMRHFASYSLNAPSPVASRIIARCGRSMYRLSGEIGKVAAHAAFLGKSTVEYDDVDACVTTTDEDDAFRLANCVLAGDGAGALECLGVKKRRRDDPIYVMGQISKVFCDLAAAAVYISEGRDKADFSREMKIHSYKAGLYMNAARLLPQAYFVKALEECAKCDILLKSTNLGYAAVERLICSLVREIGPSASDNSPKEA